MKLKYLTISDIHLGNQRNTASEIIKNLNTSFNYFDGSLYSDIDIFFLDGDFFDTIVESRSPLYHEIVRWVSRLINFCSKYDIKLRVLEGTPSHDWRQSKIFDTQVDLLKILDKKIDFLYIDTVYIEHMKDKDLYILYVPDEANSNSDITFKQVKSLMKSMDISKVDIAHMHGMFSYQLPMVSSDQAHLESDYLDITKYFINIGHIHSHSTYARIVAQGSFDRLSHNEEEPKGFVVTYIDRTSETAVYEFIENKEAKSFVTLKFKEGDSLSYCNKRIENTVKELRTGSYLRISAPDDHEVYKSFEGLKKLYSSKVFLDKKTNKKESTDLIDDVTYMSENYKPITIKRENISTLIFEELESKKIELPVSKTEAIINTIIEKVR